MWINFWHAFTKITAWPVQKLLFRTKIYYEDPAVQKRRISGPAIVISNHTSVFDFAIWLFVFWTRTLRYQMAEVLFRKPVLGPFLRLLGGIRVDRDTKNFGFMAESERLLAEGKVVGVFPEGRLPIKGEEKPLPFKPSAAYLALASGVPVIPCYTNGRYFQWKRARVLIGTPIDPSLLSDSALSERENLTRVSQLLRERIRELEKIYYERAGKNA